MLVICNPELPSSTREILNMYGAVCIDIPPCPRLQEPVCSHPDMLFSSLPDGSFITEKLYFEENRDFFRSLPDTVIIRTSDTRLSRDYPGDIAFDALRINDTVFCLEAFTAPEIRSACRTINVRQGYTKCSSLLFGNSVITADLSIHNALKNNGYDSCLIAPAGIELEGYSMGFIGGASTVIESTKTVLIFGDISLHPSYDIICDFCNKKGYKLLYDSNLYPHDFGGALFLTT